MFGVFPPQEQKKKKKHLRLNLCKNLLHSICHNQLRKCVRKKHFVQEETGSLKLLQHMQRYHSAPLHMPLVGILNGICACDFRTEYIYSL